MASSAPKTPDSGTALLAVGAEILGLGVVAILAGMDDHIGNLMIITLVGLWMLWAINHVSTLQVIPNLFAGLQKMGANN